MTRSRHLSVIILTTIAFFIAPSSSRAATTNWGFYAQASWGASHITAWSTSEDRFDGFITGRVNGQSIRAHINDTFDLYGNLTIATPTLNVTVTGAGDHGVEHSVAPPPGCSDTHVFVVREGTGSGNGQVLDAGRVGYLFGATVACPPQ